MAGAWGAMERINATPLPFAYVVHLRTFLVLSSSHPAALSCRAATLCVEAATLVLLSCSCCSLV